MASAPAGRIDTPSARNRTLANLPGGRAATSRTRGTPVVPPIRRAR